MLIDCYAKNINSDIHKFSSGQSYPFDELFPQLKNHVIRWSLTGSALICGLDKKPNDVDIVILVFNGYAADDVSNILETTSFFRKDEQDDKYSQISLHSLKQMGGFPSPNIIITYDQKEYDTWLALTWLAYHMQLDNKSQRDKLFGFFLKSDYFDSRKTNLTDADIPF